MNKILVRFVYLFYLILMFSCINHKDEEIFSTEDIKCFSEGDLDISVFKDSTIKFILLKNGNLTDTYVSQLNYIYLKDFQTEYESFDEFLYDVLNFKLIMENNYFSERSNYIFSLSNKIENEYKAEGLLYLLDNYIEKETEDTYFINTSLSLKEKYTILYYAYINHHYVIDNDGWCMIVK